jgi:hypothetical protein
MHAEYGNKPPRRFIQDGKQPRLPYEFTRAFRAVFLGNLDEPRAAQFKAQLIPFFKNSREVKRAYLVEFEFPTGGTGRGLCVKISFGNREALRSRIHAIFSSLYTRDEYLDLMFLDKAQEAEVRKTCTPFFEQVDESEDFRNRMPAHTTGLTARLCSHCASRQLGIHRAVRLAKQGDNDSGWEFYCNSGAVEDPSAAHTVPLWRVIEKEPLLLRWLDAEAGTSISRLSLHDPWEVWRDGKMIETEPPRPGKNGQNGNGNGHGMHRDGAKDAKTETNGHHPNGTNGHYANGANGHYGHGTNGQNGHPGQNGTNGDTAYAAQETTPKPFGETEEDSIRQYIALQPGTNPPFGDHLYYECLGCGCVLPSVPETATTCRCGNIAATRGNVIIKALAKARVFRQR